MIPITTSTSSKVKADRRRASPTALSRQGMSVLPCCSAVPGHVLAPRPPGLEVADDFLEVWSFPQRLEGRVGAELMEVIEAGGDTGAQQHHPLVRRIGPAILHR